MKVNLYSVRDTCLGSYLPPVVGDSDASMVRAFGDSVLASDKSSDLQRHPEDFTLERIGSFDRETGELVSCKAVVLAHGSDFRKE